MRLACAHIAALAAGVVLSGCEALGVSERVGYVAPIHGKFNETGEFAADLAFVADYGEETLTGVVRNFQFTRPGFDRPSGSIPIRGSVSRTPESEIRFQSKGQGSLTQGDQEYLFEIEVESYYIDERRRTITGGYWGGGEFYRRGEYVDWSPVSGEFRAKVLCRPNLLDSYPCPIPPPRPTAAAAAPS